MAYLAVVQGDDWTLNRNDLADALRERWPAAEVELAEQSEDADPARDVVWHHGSGLERVDGTSHESGQCIYVDGQNAAIAPVVAWFRSLVPDGEEVVFCDDTYSFDTVLEPGINAEGVLQLLEDE